MVRNLFFIFLISSTVFHIAYSQSISARASTDKANYEVGDYIHYTIEISHDHNLNVFKPALGEYAKNIDLIKSDDPVVEETKGVRKIIYRFIISKYDSADVTIPSIPIIYQFGNDTTSMVVTTNQVQFTVQTLAVNTSEEIKDIKPPILIPMGILALILILGAILLLILLALYFYRKNQKKKQKKLEQKRVYIIPPHVKAISELNALDEKKLWQQGLIKEYHSNITEIIRRYFEERFLILALESSTSEIMEQLKRVVLPENIYGKVNDFLNNADLVKFAKYKPLPAVNEEMMHQAIDIVENTVPVNAEGLNKEKVNA